LLLVQFSGNSVTALQHVYSSFTATAANENGTQIASDSSKSTDYHDNLFLRESHLQQNQNAGGSQKPGSGSYQFSCKSQSAVNENRSLPGATQNSFPAPQQTPLSYSNCCKTAVSVW